MDIIKLVAQYLGLTKKRTYKKRAVKKVHFTQTEAYRNRAKKWRREEWSRLTPEARQAMIERLYVARWGRPYPKTIGQAAATMS